MRTSSRRRGSAGQPATRVLLGAALAGGMLLVSAGTLPGASQTPIDTGMAETRRLLDAGHYAEASERARALLPVAEQSAGADSLLVADVLDVLVMARTRAGASRDAEVRRQAERAIAIRERLQGPDGPALAGSLYNLAAILKNTADYATSRTVYQRALAIWETSEGPNHPDVARALYGLGVLLNLTGEAAAATPLLERSLSIREKALGPDDPDIAQSLVGLAANLRQRADNRGAIPLYRRAVAIYEKTEGPEHPHVASALNNLGNAHTELGEYDEAKPLFQRAIDILEKSGGADNPSLGATLHSYAVALTELGDYAAARPLRDRALRIDEKALGPDHPDVADDLTGLGDLLVETGDDSAAEPLFRRALAINEKALGPDSTSVAKAAQGLADALRESGRTDEAEALYKRVLDIWIKSSGEGHPYLSKILERMSLLRRDQGDLEGARALLEQALTHWESTLGTAHPLGAIYRAELAGLLVQMGELDRARPLLEEAIPRLERGLGERSDAVGLATGELARLRWHSGDAAAALRGSLRACAILREQFELTSRSLSARQALRYMRTHPSYLNVAFTVLAAREPRPVADVRAAWNEVVHSRALVLDELAARHGAVAGRSDPSLAGLADEIEAASNRLAHLAVEGPDVEAPERFPIELRTQLDRKERAERALAGRSLVFRRSLLRRSVSLDEIARSLPARAALLAYVLYERLDGAAAKSPVPSYMAFVLAPGSTRPLAVPLGSAASVDALVQRWRQGVGRNPRTPGAPEAPQEDAGLLLRRAVWDPAMKPIAGAAQVIVVPDGSLNLVNFAALPAGRGTYLAESGPLIRFVSAERDLARGTDAVPHTPRADSTLLALGGPDFDASAAVTVAASVVRPASGPDESNGRSDAAAVFRGEESACADFRTLKFLPLPGARSEVDEIRSLFEDGRPDPSAPYVLALTGAAADEAAFKTRAPGSTLLHLATHAFFVNAACPVPRPAGGNGTPSPDAAAHLLGENPLLQSGLALAGANRRNEPGHGAEDEDGILTAEEIAALDLSRADWVVLSACGTGMGEIQAGEGVLGLRRAFEIAGAGTLVMTLWPVEDEATRVFMRALYRGRLAGLGAAEAVRQASRKMIAAGRPRGEDQPYFWGAFVATGEDR